MARRKTLSDDAVLDAALGVMVTKGPSDFTLADIGKATGLAPATLVQRFGGKQELILAAFSRENARFIESLEAAPKTRGASAVIALFLMMTPRNVDVGLFADQLLWLRQDMRDPQLNALTRERFVRLRAAIAERLPPLPMDPEDAARLVDAQWQGALNQWGLAPDEDLADYVTRQLANWFALVQERTS
jgi:AcrR family transcriptional regulator